jgi:hypothetical protein
MVARAISQLASVKGSFFFEQQPPMFAQIACAIAFGKPAADAGAGVDVPPPGPEPVACPPQPAATSATTQPAHARARLLGIIRVGLRVQW